MERRDCQAGRCLDGYVYAFEARTRREGWQGRLDLNFIVDPGGFKYNPPAAGPADTGTTKWIQDRAHEILAKYTSKVSSARNT